MRHWRHRRSLHNRRSELAAASVGTNRYGYAYDTIGNRLWSAANSETNSYAANSLNQYTSVSAGANPVYDADGNMTGDGTFAYAYDAENRLVSACPVAPSNGALAVENRCDHRSRRIRKLVKVYQDGEWLQSAAHTFVWDGNNIVLERVEFANGASRTFEYFWGSDKSGSEQGAGGVEGLLAVSMDGVFYIPCYDHNGNIVLYVSETGSIAAQYVYDPYGSVVDSYGNLADVFNFGFSTKYHDRETGMIGYQRRFYSPVLGRWLSRDPIGVRGGVNLYGFCGNNPIGLYDADGCAVRVSQANRVITVTLNITIYYANRIELNARTDLARIARRIKKQIEDNWNAQTWRYGCCTVRFVANVKHKDQVGPTGITDDNLIAITTDANHRSYSVGKSNGYWTADNIPGSDWRYAHEAGHLMGLDDDYNEQTGVPNPGHENHMMGKWGKPVVQHEVEDLLRANNVRCN